MENKIIDVCYISGSREVEVTFTNGARLACPVDALEMLTWTGSEFVSAPRPTDEQLSSVRVWAGGYAIDFPEINQNFDIDELVALLPIDRKLAGVTS
ncbi:DUF2442 domain-containing protein [cf. Phormidesmis sp. LEGE 11477]|uniref:DUF2442 domain-containing protein n=1 Tax=cf. Phormidesmis sp. LEGE 11477 TaxID=1828680 RepID=UPI00187F7F7A|nr:DUF2442 domain-containing protein [cf. Phormidesmis sp. LEGE 11477]MBE9061501.1 DUF2442 domain-containing protein [cf. Phormidesmis sp. LEGE 11477]